MNGITTIEYASLKPGYITFFARPVGGYVKHEVSEISKKNLKKNKPKGNVSAKAKNRLSAKIDWLLHISEPKQFYSKKHNRSFSFRVNFITLTLASEQIHSDQFIKKNILNQFLVELRSNHNLKHYVWRAEAQKNGNIHFHLATDRYIHHSTVRKIWNRIQNKYGYIDRYRDSQCEWHRNGFKPRPHMYSYWSKEKQYKAYLEGMKGNWSNPNSTDVHSVKNVRNLSAYLCKYMTKQDESRAIDGKLWGCSYTLSALNSCVVPISNRIRKDLRNLRSKFKHKYKSYDYHSCLYVNASEWCHRYYESLMREMKQYILECWEPPEIENLFSLSRKEILHKPKQVATAFQLELDLPNNFYI